MAVPAWLGMVRLGMVWHGLAWKEGGASASPSFLGTYKLVDLEVCLLSRLRSSSLSQVLQRPLLSPTVDSTVKCTLSAYHRDEKTFSSIDLSSGSATWRT